MTDTQWPRFEVFLTEEPGRPPEYAGSVHAPDEEMALLNARDVFARRPECTELWVVPSRLVCFRTAEQLTEISPEDEGETRIAQNYLVFKKFGHRGTLVLADRTSAPSAAKALNAVVGRSQASPLWAVVPESALTRSRPADAASFFEPAREKEYRLHSDFPTAQLMKDVTGKG